MSAARTLPRVSLWQNPFFYGILFSGVHDGKNLGTDRR
jgi:hypothetical protein